jgi:hypothetical protein
MSGRPGNPSPATIEQPTPEPSSAVVRAESADDVPEHLRTDPFVRYMMDPPPEDLANLDALLEAGELYGEDHARALADLEAGRHPLQRPLSSQR